jgi:hypothetical protein
MTSRSLLSNGSLKTSKTFLRNSTHFAPQVTNWSKLWTIQHCTPLRNSRISTFLPKFSQYQPRRWKSTVEEPAKLDKLTKPKLEKPLKLKEAVELLEEEPPTQISSEKELKKNEFVSAQEGKEPNRKDAILSRLY